MSDALTGAVGAVQRVDSALRLNMHFHILYLDGVYSWLKSLRTQSGATLPSLIGKGFSDQMICPCRGEADDFFVVAQSEHVSRRVVAEQFTGAEPALL